MGQFRTQEQRERQWADAEEGTTGFMAARGEQLPQRWRATYERVLPM